jgi:hypothetical protein
MLNERDLVGSEAQGSQQACGGGLGWESRRPCPYLMRTSSPVSRTQLNFGVVPFSRFRTETARQVVDDGVCRQIGVARARGRLVPHLRPRDASSRSSPDTTRAAAGGGPGDRSPQRRVAGVGFDERRFRPWNHSTAADGQQ